MNLLSLATLSLFLPPVCPKQSADYYWILGVQRLATFDEIKRAYKKLAKEWHPDKTEHPRASEIFIKIQDAYDVLRSDCDRDVYDRTNPNVGKFYRMDGKSWSETQWDEIRKEGFNDEYWKRGNKETFQFHYPIFKKILYVVEITVNFLRKLYYCARIVTEFFYYLVDLMFRIYKSLLTVELKSFWEKIFLQGSKILLVQLGSSLCFSSDFISRLKVVQGLIFLCVITVLIPLAFPVACSWILLTKEFSRVLVFCLWTLYLYFILPVIVEIKPAPRKFFQHQRFEIETFLTWTVAILSVVFIFRREQIGCVIQRPIRIVLFTSGIMLVFRELPNKECVLYTLWLIFSIFYSEQFSRRTLLYCHIFLGVVTIFAKYSLTLKLSLLIEFSVRYGTSALEEELNAVVGYALEISRNIKLWITEQANKIQEKFLLCLHRFRLLRWRWFEKDKRLISRKKYDKEGVRETEKALEELRLFCQRNGRIQTHVNPVRFRQFVRGSAHITEEEQAEFQIR